MKLAFCEWCGSAMTLHVEGQRFHSRECSDFFYQAERHAAVEYFRAQGMRPATQADAQRQDEGVR